MPEREKERESELKTKIYALLCTCIIIIQILFQIDELKCNLINDNIRKYFWHPISVELNALTRKSTDGWERRRWGVGGWGGVMY